MTPEESTEIRFYTRPGCHLCDSVYEVVQRTRTRYPFVLKILNVEEDPELERQYGQEIPVVEVQSSKATRTFRHRLDEDVFDQEIRRLWNR